MAEPNNENRRLGDVGLENLRRETDYRFEAIAQRFVAIEHATAMALAAAKEAVLKAELAQEKRFDAVSTQIDVLTKSMDTLAGKATGVSSSVGMMLAVATIVISIVIFVANLATSK